MKTISTLAAVTACGMLTTGCFMKSSPAVAKTVSTDEFNEIVYQGSGDINITVGEATSVNIDGAEDRVDNVTFEVEDGRLVIEEDSGLFTTGDLKIDITVSELSYASFAGSSDAKVKGLTGEEFKLLVSGSADVKVDGEVDTLDISVSGSSDVNAKSLTAKSVVLQVSGASDINLAASETLNVSASGASDVTYYGEPEITKSLSGASSLDQG